MPELFHTVLAFVVVLGILVFIHELGHYLLARWCGVHVESFSIGFGPSLLKWADGSGTEWRIGCLPLGGYVKPHGFEGPDEATEEQKAAWLPGRTFHDKSVYARAAVILAGPVFNFILAFVIFSVLCATAGQVKVSNTIRQVQAASAAAAAGVRNGDVIRSIGDHTIANVSDLQFLVGDRAGQQTTVTVLRDGHSLTFPITIGSVPGKGGRPPHGQIGVEFAVERTAPLSPGAAIVAGAAETWNVTVQTLGGLWQVLSGQHTARDLGGPLKIAQISGQAAHYGLASLLSFMGLLSVNLGLINLFPIPVLDGGRLVFYALEAIRGRPVSRAVQNVFFQAGFVLIAGLFLFSTFNDLSGFGLFRWVASLVG
ncbi:RIP metalloprotease RseP [Acetobacter sp. AN02]|uniref:RIP metalloprotease RseP n=1 Tax=Acetobacter sp. AN02 TaxID=2894186 RepID=UPI0024343AE5|nr:RIP metalloprotease RseP [Acetobacter sp. AN02]MDG6094375.1 RIP metalloprotease RseP [Acetobacter sp. AN02]